MKFKNTLKKGILFLGISLLLWNCENEDLTIDKNKELQTPEFQISISSETKDIVQLNKIIFQDFLPSKGKSKFNKDLSLKNNSYDFTIDTSFVRTITTKSYKSHTFKVIRENYSPLVLENYVITVYNNQSYKQFLVKYTRKDTVNDFSIKSTSIKVLKGKRLYFSREGNGENCMKFEHREQTNYTPFDCNDFGDIGDGSHSGGQACDDGVVRSGFIVSTSYVLVSVKSECNGGIDSGDNPFTDPSGNVSNGGNGNRFPNNNIEEETNDEDNFDDPIVIIPIEEISDCEIANNLGANCNDLLSFEQDYKNRMSQSELKIFNSISRVKQLGYLLNAQKATWEAENLFPNSLYNGKGDAFRHAFFNALNSILLGVDLAEKLSTAHENKPPTYQFNYKENQMDLFNNAVGRTKSNWFSDGYGSLTKSILDAMSKGELRYLTNLAGGGSSGQATSSSILIPTN